MTILISLALALFTVSGASSYDTAAASEDTQLKKELGDLGIPDFWFYDNLGKARKKAASEKKPLLIVFRCVP